ncbi:MAG: heavy-metal-associated domain-containing protein, partial [Clostridiales Family XIII bacterium]|nr:heavy-metal-associated domain-containing protein [Clostridiales Family XIII bacterium]
MMCINCRNKVEKALTGTPGVESAAVSHEAG